MTAELDSDNKFRLPTWVWGMLGSLILIVLVGAFTLISRFTVLETQVTENKKDREKQVDKLEERIIKEFDRAEYRTNRELENLDGQIDELEAQMGKLQREEGEG